MSQIVTNLLELEVINATLISPLSLRLYSNNVTPAGTDTLATYTEVTGGGYAAKSLTFASWTIQQTTPPTSAINTSQLWTFTGPTTGPGTIYGYYVVRVSDSKLLWAERFPALLVPFSPIAGSRIAVLPKFTVESQF